MPLKFIIPLLVLLLCFACREPQKPFIDLPCLARIDSIAQHQTFREAIKPAQTCLEKHPEDVKVNLKLAELYLLTYLVDEDAKGLVSAVDLLIHALNTDPEFGSNHQDFNLNQEELKAFRKHWDQVKDQNSPVKERLLIWALIDDFHPDKKPNHLDQNL